MMRLIVNGRLRITLTPLLNDMPIVGAIQVLSSSLLLVLVHAMAAVLTSVPLQYFSALRSCRSPDEGESIWCACSLQN